MVINYPAYERLQHMASRMGDKKEVTPVLIAALSLYESLDQHMGPTDSLWIKRDNQLIGVEGFTFPNSASDKPEEKVEEKKKIVIPSNWGVIKGGKE